MKWLSICAIIFLSKYSLGATEFKDLGSTTCSTVNGTESCLKVSLRGAAVFGWPLWNDPVSIDFTTEIYGGLQFSSVVLPDGVANIRNLCNNGDLYYSDRYPDWVNKKNNNQLFSYKQTRAFGGRFEYNEYFEITQSLSENGSYYPKVYSVKFKAKCIDHRETVAVETRGEAWDMNWETVEKN